MKSSLDPDIDNDKATAPSPYWKVLYSLSIRVTIGVPDNLPGLVKQQIRWRKESSTGVLFQQEKYFGDVHFMSYAVLHNNWYEIYSSIYSTTRNSSPTSCWEYFITCALVGRYNVYWNDLWSRL